MKGLSPLLAAVLLIAFTVALATVIFGFLSTTFRATTATIANRTAEGVDCSSAAIKIEDVYIVGSIGGTTFAVVRNTGGVDNLLIQDAIALNTTGGNFTSSTTPVTDFDRGEIARLQFATTYQTCPAAFSKVVVSTNCGGISDIFDSTPKCS